MIKTILIAAISADGKIAERADQSSLDWTSKEDTQFFVERTKEAGVVIMGRKTFETIGRSLKDRLIVVMTRGEGGEAMEGVEHTNRAPKIILQDLEARGYEQAAICGGAEIYSLFLRAGLVDELFLTIEPVLFGSGTPLVSGFDRLNLELMDSRPLNAQAILLHYRVLR